MGASLQYSGGRAVVGLIDPRGPSRLALRTQRANGSFGPLRVFLRVSEELDFFTRSAEYNDVQIAPDGRGGQVAALERGSRPNRYLQLVHKPRGRAARTIARQRDEADNYNFSPLSVSPDGWTALAYRRAPVITSLNSSIHVLVVSPRGRIRSTRLTGLGDFYGPAASVTRGGAGAAGFAGTALAPGFRSAASFLPLSAGLPLPAGALLRGVGEAVIGNIVMTSNPRDRARVVWEEGKRVLPSRLE